MVRAVVEYLGGFVIVVFIYFLYRTWTDDLITNEFWRGFLAAIVAVNLTRLHHDLWKAYRK